MWLWPAVRMTMMWSAPCQAVMRMRRMSSSKRPEAISVVTTQSGCGSMSPKYFAAGSGTLRRRLRDVSRYENGPRTWSSTGVRQVHPRRRGR